MAGCSSELSALPLAPPRRSGAMSQGDLPHVPQRAIPSVLSCPGPSLLLRHRPLGRRLVGRHCNHDGGASQCSGVFVLRSMSMSTKAGALDLASGLGGEIAQDDVRSAVEQYEKYHQLYGGEAESRASNYADVANKYYSLVTSFYEYGWGESFHFANRWHGETLRESIKRYEHFIALRLGLKEGMKVLDVGCGIGGPLREIARFSSASVTGLNNNEYQIKRAQELIFSAGLSKQCNFVKGDFMAMPFPDDTFDAVYAIEATCHAPDAVGCYGEIRRVVRPGQLVAFYEWCMTDRFDPGDARHAGIKAEIELGNGLTDIRTTRQCLQAVRDAGLEVVSARDVAEESPVPWYQPLDSGGVSWTGFRLSRVGRFVTRAMVTAMERLGVAPEGSVRVSSLLETAGDGLAKAGREGIFTPMFFVLARKKPVAD